MASPRRALIGTEMRLPDGRAGKVTGITEEGIARVAVGPAEFVDIDQDLLTRPMKGKRERAIVEFNEGDWMVMFPTGRIAAYENPEAALRAVQGDASKRLGKFDAAVTTIEWRGTPAGFVPPKGEAK